MRWYKHLYVGEKAKKRRFSIIQNIRRNHVQAGVHIITPASCGENILDIYPSDEFLKPDRFKDREELLILGIGADYFEALEVAGKIINDMYRKTGGFSLDKFL